MLLSRLPYCLPSNYSSGSWRHHSELMLFRRTFRICLGLCKVLIVHPLQPHSPWAEEKNHWHPLLFQVWLFHQKPESLDPLVKYLSATTGFGSNYVTSKKVNVSFVSLKRLLLGSWPALPAAQLLSPGAPVSTRWYHMGLFSFLSALSCLSAMAHLLST